MRDPIVRIAIRIVVIGLHGGTSPSWYPMAWVGRHVPVPRFHGVATTIHIGWSLSRARWPQRRGWFRAVDTWCVMSASPVRAPLLSRVRISSVSVRVRSTTAWPSPAQKAPSNHHRLSWPIAPLVSGWPPATLSHRQFCRPACVSPDAAPMMSRSARSRRIDTRARAHPYPSPNATRWLRRRQRIRRRRPTL